MQSARSPALGALLALAVAAVVLATLARAPYGLDVQDEPMIVATAEQFGLGAQPLVDELMVSPQLTSLLVAPAVSAYTAVAGRDGLVLFTRLLYLLFALALALLLAWVLARFVERASAMLVAAAVVAFVPFSFLQFHQNTVGGLALAVGLFAASAVALARPRSVGLAAVAGLLHGLAVFAYPFLAVPVAVFLVAAAVAVRRAPGRVVAAYGTALTLPLVALAGIVAWAGPEAVRTSFEYGNEFLGQGGGLGKLRATLRYRFDAFPTEAKLATGALVVAAVAARRWRPRLAPHLLLALPLVPLAGLDWRSNIASVDYVANVALLAPLALPFLASAPAVRRLLLLVWPPALAGGLVVSWASSNDGINFAIGALAGALVLLAAIVAVHPRAGLASVAAVLAALVAFQYGSVYGDARLASLDERLGAGPYAGVRTSPERAQLVMRLSADLARAAGEPLLVYDELPLAHLVDAREPAAPTLWVLHRPTRAYRALLLAEGAERPATIVRVLELPRNAPGYRPLTYDGDPLTALLRDGYRRVVARQEYEVWVAR